MKRIRIILYVAAAMLGMLIPFQVSAAGQDTVTLSQEGENVAVLLEMSDAEKENITAVSVSLQIDTQSSDQIAVDFEFSPELGNHAEYGFKYKESGDNAGRLDIYAVTGTADSLFGENGLALGSLKVSPKNASAIIPVTISYCDGSFQTANAAFGSKTPMVEQETASVSMQIGGGAITPPPEENPGSGNEEQNPGTDIPGTDTPGTDTSGTDNPGGGSSGSGGSNMDEGLYDDTTQFTNDPSNAQNIPSAIIGKDNTATGFVDLSAVPGQNSGNKQKTKGKGAAQSAGKVSIVAPKDGMSSILVSNADSNTSKEEGNEPPEDTSALPEDSMEIKLDKENGGTVKQHGIGIGKILPIIGLAIAGILMIVLLIFAVIKMRDTDRQKRKHKKKKAAKRNKRKHSGNRKRRHHPKSHME